VCELETLEAIARFGFLTDNVEDGINEFGTFGVVTLGPVISGTGLSEDKVIWAEDLTEWARSNGVHGSWFEIDEDGSWNVLLGCGFVEVHIDTFELEIGITVEGTGGINAVLI